MRLALLCAGFLLLANTCAQGQTVPILLGITTEAKDEFGHTLLGTHPSSADVGVPHVLGDLVQVLSADNGVYPPQVNGAPDPANSVIGESRIGEGVSPAWTCSGQFAGTITEGHSGFVFIRVFNAPTAEQASFYADSQVFQVSSATIEPLLGDVAATDRPIDNADDDGDRLNNSWEKSYGTNPFVADSDMDGTSDGAEVEAGTDPTDAESEFIASRLFLENGRLVMDWQSVPGMSYVVECQAGGPDVSATYEPITSVITATSDQSQVEVPECPLGRIASYRIRLVNP